MTWLLNLVKKKVFMYVIKLTCKQIRTLIINKFACLAAFKSAIISSMYCFDWLNQDNCCWLESYIKVIKSVLCLSNIDFVNTLYQFYKKFLVRIDFDQLNFYGQTAAFSKLCKGFTLSSIIFYFVLLIILSVFLDFIYCYYYLHIFRVLNRK